VVSLGSLPRLRWGRSTRVEEGTGAGGEREGDATEMLGGGGFGPMDEGEYWLLGGRTNSCWFGKPHSFFTPEADLRSCCPEMRAEPANICGWDMGAPLKEACRKLSSYLTPELDSCPGVELGRTMAEAEGFQFSDSEYGDRPESEDKGESK